MTDPQTFLWSPTTSFRQRMGYVRVSPHGTAGAVSASGFGEPAEKEEKSAKDHGVSWFWKDQNDITITVMLLLLCSFLPEQNMGKTMQNMNSKSTLSH